jgi:hypothetical protein
LKGWLLWDQELYQKKMDECIVSPEFSGEEIGILYESLRYILQREDMEDMKDHSNLYWKFKDIIRHMDEAVCKENNLTPPD